MAWLDDEYKKISAKKESSTNTDSWLDDEYGKYKVKKQEYTNALQINPTSVDTINNIIKPIADNPQLDTKINEQQQRHQQIKQEAGRQLPILSAMQGLSSGFSLGMDKKIGKPQTELESEISAVAKKEHPIISGVSNFAGSILSPIWKVAGGISSLVGKGISKLGIGAGSKVLSNPITKTALKEGLTGAQVGAAEGTIKGESPLNIAKKSAQYGLMGAGGGALIKGAGVGIKSAKNKLSGKVSDMFESPLQGVSGNKAPTIQKPFNKFASAKATSNISNKMYPNASNTMDMIPQTFTRKATQQATQQVATQQATQQVAKLPTQGTRKLVGKIPKPKQATESAVNPNIATAQKEVPKISEMTKQQFDAYYKLDQAPTKANVEKIIEDVGKRVIKRTGTSDIPTIVKEYTKKYNLPDNIKISYNLKKGTSKGSTNVIRDGNGNITGAKININPDQSIEQKVGALRHEIEHYKDLVEGFTPQTNKFLPNKSVSARGLYESASKGHHKNYGWFEPDYIRRASIKDSLKAGQKVPESVLKEYPDLANVKPLKTSTPKQIQQTTPVTATESKLTQPTTILTAPTQKTVQPPKAVAKTIQKPIQKATPVKQTTPVTPVASTKQAKQFKVFNKLDETGATNQRGFVKNIKSDTNMNDKVREAMTQDVGKYNTLTNETTLKSANAKFSQGYEKALRDFQTSSSFGADDVPLSRMLANESAKRGDIKTAREIISKMAEKLTDAGRMSQASKILRKSDPSAFVSYIDRYVARINKEGRKEFGTKWKDVVIPDEKIKEIYKLELFDETAFERTMADMGDTINSQIPVTAMEKINSWRRMSMLLNPTTHMRNYIGNTLMREQRRVSDTIATAIETVILKNKPLERTKALNWKSKNPTILTKVDDSWELVKKGLTEYGRYDIESLHFGATEKKIFKTKWLQAMNDFSHEMLNKGDIPFLRGAYKNSLGQFMTARNLTTATDEAVEYATKRSLEATYRQVNAMSNLINKAKRTKGGFLIEAGVPFSKTPSNIAKTAFDYSPAGILRLFSSGKTVAQKIDIIANAVTGTGIIGAGYLLASLGLGRSERSSSKAVEGLLQEGGSNQYSIKTPLGSYTFDWANPPSIPIAMGMSIWESMQDKDANTIQGFTDAFVNAIITGGDTLINMSILRNIKQMIGGYGSTTEKLMELPIAFVEQMIPTISGQLARSIDSTKRTTYDPNKGKMALNRFRTKLPLASKTLEPHVNIWGEETKQSNALMQFTSPGRFLQDSKDKATKIVSAIYNKEKDNKILPRIAPRQITDNGIAIKLSPAEITEYQRTMGKLNHTDITNQADRLSNTSYTNQVAILSGIVAKNYNIAKQQLLRKRKQASSTK